MLGKSSTTELKPRHSIKCLNWKVPLNFILIWYLVVFVGVGLLKTSNSPSFTLPPQFLILHKPGTRYSNMSLLRDILIFLAHLARGHINTKCSNFKNHYSFSVFTLFKTQKFKASIETQGNLSVINSCKLKKQITDFNISGTEYTLSPPKGRNMGLIREYWSKARPKPSRTNLILQLHV